MHVTLRPAVVSDASWITANLRPLDHEEAFCQLPPDTPTSALARWLVMSGEAFIAYLDDEPTTLFGTSPMSASCFGVWAIGTSAMKRTIPAVSRYFMQHHIEKRITHDGLRTAEARSLASHTQAHAWMRSLGAEQVTPEPFPYGRNDEPFLLFRWTVAGYRAIREKRWMERA